MPRKPQRQLTQFSIPEKANRILNLVLVTMLLLTVRIWHLSVIQYDSRLEESRKPQRRVVVEAARRATIRDRFNIPLAINSMQYSAYIQYSQLRQIPSVAWSKDANGKRIKRFKRKEHIANLAKLLGEELQMEPERLEDLIHAKGPFYYQMPFVIKEDISEKEYYRLKMLAKDWLGIHVQRHPRRTYPKGKVGADIIGYMGAINRQEYEAVIHEIKTLEYYIKEFEAGETPPLPPEIENIAQARYRLKELQERAYKINDSIGKSGIESQFDEQLRGYQGKKSYYSDARGNFLRELPGSRDPLPGQRFLLTISSELQEFAEQLLIKNESLRQAHLSNADLSHQVAASKQPWIKGGAIVVMDPNNGEVLTMASYPRIDPNDFISSGNPELNSIKNSNIIRWFETEDYLAEIWDQKRALEREIYDQKLDEYRDENLIMTWETYLKFALPADHPVKKTLERYGKIKHAINLQQAIATLLSYSGQSDLYWLLSAIYRDEEHQTHLKKMPTDVRQAIEENLNWHTDEVEILKKTIEPYFADLPHDYDKVLLVDMMRLIIDWEKVSNELLPYISESSLSSHRTISAAIANVIPFVKEKSKTLFRSVDFKAWRTLNEKDFLKQKRSEEKITLKYPKPYIDYLDSKEKQMFQEFWNKNHSLLLESFITGRSPEKEIENYTSYFITWHKEINNGAHSELPWKKSYATLLEALKTIPSALTVQYLQSLRTFQDLDSPLLGQYKHLRKQNGISLEKHLAAAFYPLYGFGYGRSFAFRQATTQGSLFKLVTAYTALVQRYNKLDPKNITKKNLNPLTITDKIEKTGKDWIVGYHEDGKPILQMYKGGRVPRSSSRNIGKVDLLQAIEHSSNPYFALIAGDILSSPNDITDSARNFSYGSKTGIELPAEIKGNVPKDLVENRTGLYATAIGQHSLVVTPLQSSVMLSAIANGGKVLKPKIIHMAIGTQRNSVDTSSPIVCPPHFAYQDSLALVGIDFPLFTSTISQDKKNLVTRCATEVSHELFMPEIVRSMLLEGMKRVVKRIHNPSFGTLAKMYEDYPEALSDFIDTEKTLAGKTSTSEVIENFDLDLMHGTDMYTHVWFGGISFNPNDDSKSTFISRDSNGKPELVVIVYLRFGKYGKDAAPVAAQVIQKWKEIKSSH